MFQVATRSTLLLATATTLAGASTLVAAARGTRATLATRGARGRAAPVTPLRRLGHIEAVPARAAVDDAPALAAVLRRATPADTARSYALANVLLGAAHQTGLPIALVLGVLLAENPAFDSRARWADGSRGLLRVRPAAAQAHASRFGADLTDDRTNLYVGARVLADLTGAERDWQVALRRYHGCARAAASHSADCAAFPGRVRAAVERHRVALCGALTFEECVVASLSGTYLDEHAG